MRLNSDKVLRICVSVEVTPELRERIKCVAASEAARMLGLSKQRVSGMLNDGVLHAVPLGNKRLVTLASNNKRKENPRGAGRPKKVIAN